MGQLIDSKPGPGKGIGMFIFYKEKWLTVIIVTIVMSIQTVPVHSEKQLFATHSVNYISNIISVNNSINYTGTIYAIAISIHLPSKVRFISSSTNTQPIIQPQKGDTGTLEFVWIKPPESPFQLMYSVESAATSGSIHSKIIYRRLNGSLNYDLPEVQLVKGL